MLETLVGRLRWERTGTGIQVEIPARLSWVIAFLCVWVTGWSMAGWNVINKTFAADNPPLFDLVWLVGWFAGEVTVIAIILWSLTGCFTLNLDNQTLEITRKIAGIKLDKRVFTTANVRNLRYIPATTHGRSSRQSEIRFEADDKTCGFASGIADSEAFSLIDKMLEIFPFPKERALEYLDLTS
jgi:hypothetical protein